MSAATNPPTIQKAKSKGALSRQEIEDRIKAIKALPKECSVGEKPKEYDVRALGERYASLTVTDNSPLAFSQEMITAFNKEGELECGTVQLSDVPESRYRYMMPSIECIQFYRAGVRALDERQRQIFVGEVAIPTWVFCAARDAFSLNYINYFEVKQKNEANADIIERRRAALYAASPFLVILYGWLTVGGDGEPLEDVILYGSADLPDVLGSFTNIGMMPPLLKAELKNTCMLLIAGKLTYYHGNHHLGSVYSQKRLGFLNSVCMSNLFKDLDLMGEGFIGYLHALVHLPSFSSVMKMLLAKRQIEGRTPTFKHLVNYYGEYPIPSIIPDAKVFGRLQSTAAGTSKFVHSYKAARYMTTFGVLPLFPELDALVGAVKVAKAAMESPFELGIAAPFWVQDGLDVKWTENDLWNLVATTIVKFAKGKGIANSPLFDESNFEFDEMWGKVCDNALNSKIAAAQEGSIAHALSAVSTREHSTTSLVKSLAVLNPRQAQEMLAKIRAYLRGHGTTLEDAIASDPEAVRIAREVSRDDYSGQTFDVLKQAASAYAVCAAPVVEASNVAPAEVPRPRVRRQETLTEQEGEEDIAKTDGEPPYKRTKGNTPTRSRAASVSRREPRTRTARNEADFSVPQALCNSIIQLIDEGKPVQEPNAYVYTKPNFPDMTGMVPLNKAKAGVDMTAQNDRGNKIGRTLGHFWGDDLDNVVLEGWDGEVPDGYESLMKYFARYVCLPDHFLPKNDAERIDILCQATKTIVQQAWAAYELAEKIGFRNYFTFTRDQLEGMEPTKEDLVILKESKVFESIVAERETA